jgi:transposase-like protein
MHARTHGNAHKRWTDLLNQFDQSGLTVAEFCRRERCSAASFYQWRRKLRSQKSGRSAGPTFVPIKIADAAPSRSLQAIVSLDLPGGVRLRIKVPAAATPSEKQEGTP